MVVLDDFVFLKLNIWFVSLFTTFSSSISDLFLNLYIPYTVFMRAIGHATVRLGLRPRSDNSNFWIWKYALRYRDRHIEHNGGKCHYVLFLHNLFVSFLPKKYSCEILLPMGRAFLYVNAYVIDMFLFL